MQGFKGAWSNFVPRATRTGPRPSPPVEMGTRGIVEEPVTPTSLRKHPGRQHADRVQEAKNDAQKHGQADDDVRSNIRGTVCEKQQGESILNAESRQRWLQEEEWHRVRSLCHQLVEADMDSVTRLPGLSQAQTGGSVAGGSCVSASKTSSTHRKYSGCSACGSS